MYSRIFDAFQICLGFFVVFSIAGTMMYITEKTGFNRWLRGWLWCFGFVDSEKESEHTDELPAGFFDRKKDR
jgi:hypothetical protein